MLLEKGAQPDLKIEYGCFTGESPLSMAKFLDLEAKLLQSCVQRE